MRALRRVCSAPYMPGLLLVTAAALGGLRAPQPWLLFGVVFLAWFVLSGRALRAAGRETALLFFCWLAAASLFSSDLPVSLQALARYAVFAVLFFSAKRGDEKGWLPAVLGLGLAASLFFIAQRALGMKITGFIGENPNYSALFTAAAFPAALLAAGEAQGRRRLVYALLVPVLAAGLALSGSRGALAAALLSAAAGLAVSGRTRALAALLLAAAGAAALLPAASLEGLLKVSDPRAFARPLLWGAALKAAAASPLLGWGPGLFEKVFELFKFPYFDGVAYYGHTTLHAHGELFNLAAEAGFPAALLFAAAAFTAILSGGRANLPLKLAALAVFIQGGVDMVFYSGAVSLCFWGTLGVLSAGDTEEDGSGAGYLLPAAALAGLCAAVFLPGPRPPVRVPGAYYEEALAFARFESLKAPLSPFPEAASGEVLLSAGDAAGAEAAYKRALALEPNFSGARLGLAAVYGKAGRRAEACAELTLAGRAAALRTENSYQENITFLDAEAEGKLDKKLCGKKRTGGATAPGRKTR